MQEWTEREFGQYPYLWFPPAGSEIAREVGLIADESQSLVAVLQNEGRVVGIAGGVPFDGLHIQAYFHSLNSSFGEKLRTQGVDPTRIFHMVFFLTDPVYRDTSVGMIYDTFTAFARKLGRDQFCFFEAIGDPDYAAVPFEPWNAIIKNCRKVDIQLDVSWPTLQNDDSVQDEVHRLQFFINEI
jgi:hypothetical protein